MSVAALKEKGRTAFVRLFRAGASRGVSVLIPLALIPSCTSFQDSSGSRSEIRYANLSVLVDAECEGDSEWPVLAEKKRGIQKRLDELKGSKNPSAAQELEEKDLSFQLDQISNYFKNIIATTWAY